MAMFMVFMAAVSCFILSVGWAAPRLAQNLPSARLASASGRLLRMAVGLAASGCGLYALTKWDLLPHVFLVLVLVLLAPIMLWVLLMYCTWCALPGSAFIRRPSSSCHAQCVQSTAAVHSREQCCQVLSW
jgi:hypothetical protein